MPPTVWQEMLEGSEDCICPAYSAWHTFSKVSALVHLLYKAIIEMTFENACPQQLQYGRLFGNLEGQYAQFVFDGNIGVVI